MRATVLTAAACVLLASGASAARELDGVTLPDTVSVEGREMKLIGMGVRTKWMVRVYVAGLYAQKPTFNADKLITSDQPKSITLHLVRDVGREKIIEAIQDGFAKNSSAELPALQARLDQLAAAIPDLKSGQELILSYLPGKGTVVGGVATPTVLEGQDFAQALFAVWLGKDPADSDLKRKLLGG
ncbi:MAG TPA: chalcone isomerase family protein [Myxococcaceae bacterium]|nr:chalcone isomerase family protein [Myxococcaceae bacterium]